MKRGNRRWLECDGDVERALLKKGIVYQLSLEGCVCFDGDAVVFVRGDEPEATERWAMLGSVVGGVMDAGCQRPQTAV